MEDYSQERFVGTEGCVPKPTLFACPGPRWKTILRRDSWRLQGVCSRLRTLFACWAQAEKMLLLSSEFGLKGVWIQRTLLELQHMELHKFLMINFSQKKGKIKALFEKI